MILQDVRLIYDKQTLLRNIYRYLTIPAFKVTVRYRMQQHIKNRLKTVKKNQDGSSSNYGVFLFKAHKQVLLQFEF